jgi:pimeloyl-ACP methyl ester carboxylesterase
MSAASAFRSRFTTVRHVVPASTPSFKLACNVYRHSLSAQQTTSNSTVPPMVFTHANGFHKELWEPVISRLSPHWTTGDMYAFDCRNHGDSAVLNKDVLADQCKSRKDTCPLTVIRESRILKATVLSSRLVLARSRHSENRGHL